MHAIRKPGDKVTYNKSDINKVVEDFQSDLYSSNDQMQNEEEIKRALKDMEREKTPGESRIRHL